MFNDAQNRYLQERRFKKGQGCSRCNNTGYNGRIGIFELLVVTPEMSVAIRDRNDDRFNQLVQEDTGYRRLYECAMDYALQGLTTLDEVARVAEQIEEFVNEPAKNKSSLAEGA